MSLTTNPFLIEKKVTDTAVYTPEDYEFFYPELIKKTPEYLTISLGKDFSDFSTSVVDTSVTAEQVVHLACFYFGDIDPVRSVCDELLTFQDTNITTMWDQLNAMGFDSKTIDSFIESKIAVVNEASSTLQNTVMTLLNNIDATAVEGYGSCYQLDHIHNNNVLVLRRVRPEEIYQTLES